MLFCYSSSSSKITRRRLTGAGGGEFAELNIWMLNVQLDMEAPWKIGNWLLATGSQWSSIWFSMHLGKIRLSGVLLSEECKES